LKFKCLNCEDSCCSRKTVALTHKDVIRIDSYIENNVFDYLIFIPELQGSAIVKGDKYSGVMTLKRENGECVFLKDNKCQIHPVRPIACRMYPCNPIFTEYKNGTKLVIKNNECPGIGKGDEFDIKSLAVQWRNERLEYEKIINKWNGNLIDFVKDIIK